MRSRVRLFLSADAAPLPLHPRELRSLAARMLSLLSPKRGGRVDLILVRDAEIARLNVRHLACPGPTNCLAFPDGGGGAGTRPEGSLFLSLDALERECLLYDQEPERHLRRLLAHGLSHLAGFAHGPEMELLCRMLENPDAEGA